MVSKEHLFFILIEIAKNTDLQIDFTPRDNAGIIGNRVYRFPSSLLDKKIKWIHVYDIEIKIKQIDELLVNNKKKCIWFFVTTSPVQIYSGPVGSCPLDKLHIYDLLTTGKIADTSDNSIKRYFREKDNDTLNHLNEDVLKHDK